MGIELQILSGKISEDSVLLAPASNVYVSEKHRFTMG